MTGAQDLFAPMADLTFAIEFGHDVVKDLVVANHALDEGG